MARVGKRTRTSGSDARIWTDLGYVSSYSCFRPPYHNNGFFVPGR